MIHFNKNIFVAFTLVSSFSLWSEASDFASDFPSSFGSHYFLTKEGGLFAIGGSADNTISETTEVYTRTGVEGSLSWSIKSLTCAQNKSFKCVGIYKNETSKIQGNKMNPLNPVLNESGFTLLKMNPKNSEQNSVIKCNSRFTENMIRDEANLTNCVEYSKAICKNWADYIEKNAAEFTKVIDKVEECTDVMKSVDKINVGLRNTFQSEIKQSEKDISESFDSAAHPDRRVGIGTKVELSQSKLSPHISTYKDLLERTADCKKYGEFFSKGFDGISTHKRWTTLPTGKAIPSDSAASAVKKKQ